MMKKILDTRNAQTISMVVLELCIVSVRADDTQSASAQANNPLANMTAFNLQNYSIGELAESGEDANQFWFRYARFWASLQQFSRVR